jgi:hypothetical protein
MNRDEDKNFYDSFDELLEQITDDQSLFEADPPDTCHELVLAGRDMVDALTEFRALGNFFWMTLPEIDLMEIQNAVEQYKLMLLPPNICFGLNKCCPCLVKLQRSGVEYEKKLMTTHALLVESGYSVRLIVLEQAIDKMNTESMHYVEYVNRMNAIFNSLGSISTRGSDQSRDNARVQLLALLEQVDRFVKHYFPEEGENHLFRMEASRRVVQTGEILSSKPVRQSQGNPSTPSTGIHRRILVKALANMQEIMNSAVGIAAAKANEFAESNEVELNTCARISGDLLVARDKRIKSISDLENRALNLQLDDLIARIKEDGERRHNDALGKLREAVKRWKVVKTQSVYRNVAVYEEDDSSSATADPMKVLNKTGKQMGDGLKKAANIPGNAAIGFVGGITGAVGAVTSGVKGAATGIASGVKGAASGIAKGMTEAVDGIKETFENLGEGEKKEEKKKGLLSGMVDGGDTDMMTANAASKLFQYTALNGSMFG